MYLHLGQGTVVRLREVVGIFDMENATISKYTRQFLADAEKGGRVCNVTMELPKMCIRDSCKGLHARRTAAKKTQRLFLRHLQDFKLCRLDIQANLPCRGFLGFLKCRRFLDRFFTHGSPSFHVTGSSG